MASDPTTSAVAGAVAAEDLVPVFCVGDSVMSSSPSVDQRAAGPAITGSTVSDALLDDGAAGSNAV